MDDRPGVAHECLDRPTVVRDTERPRMQRHLEPRAVAQQRVGPRHAIGVRTSAVRPLERDCCTREVLGTHEEVQIMAVPEPPGLVHGCRQRRTADDERPDALPLESRERLRDDLPVPRRSQLLAQRRRMQIGQEVTPGVEVASCHGARQERQQGPRRGQRAHRHRIASAATGPPPCPPITGTRPRVEARGQQRGLVGRREQDRQRVPKRQPHGPDPPRRRRSSVALTTCRNWSWLAARCRRLKLS